MTYLLAALAAATILSKRGSPRKSSQHGLKRRSPYVGAGSPESSRLFRVARARGRARRSTRKPAPGWRPSSDPIERVLGNRHEIDRAPCLADRVFFSAKPSIKSRDVARSTLHPWACRPMSRSIFLRAAANAASAFCLSPRARATCPSAQLRRLPPKASSAHFAGVAAITRFAAS